MQFIIISLFLIIINFYIFSVMVWGLAKANLKDLLHLEDTRRILMIGQCLRVKQGETLVNRIGLERQARNRESER